MNDKERLIRCTANVLQSPSNVHFVRELDAQLAKCQNKSSHDGTVTPHLHLWQCGRDIHSAAKILHALSEDLERLARE